MIEKIKSEIEKLTDGYEHSCVDNAYQRGVSDGAKWIKKKAIEIVQEVAKDGGWISCSERLPEHMQQCLTTARIYYVPDHVDEPDNYIGVELNTYSKNFGWLYNPEVIAWQPLPAPYQKGE